mgnify:CR=1 FL=1
MKNKLILLSAVLILLFFAGCARTTPNEPDTTTGASMVDTAVELKQAIGKSGTWIICLTKDITVSEDLVLEGEFKKDGGETQRKLALYSQDENRNITKRYTLTAPKLTIKSPMASIQHGTFKGDLYVEASNFKLVDTTVEGNVYFATEEAQSTFSMDEESKITGKQELLK